MIRVFADETGDDTTMFAIGSWLADCNEWMRFSEAWQAELDLPPRIKYFNNNEALGKKAQFQDWPDAERNKKMLALANVIARYDLVGFFAPVDLRRFKSLYSKSIVPKKSLRGILRWTEPYHFVCPCIIAQGLGYQIVVQKNLTDKIDFVFDRGVRYLEDCIANYPKLLTVLPVASQRIAGTVTSGDDKEMVALQAADMLAGQLWATFRDNKATECAKVLESKRLYLLDCMKNQFDRIPNAISIVNLGWTVKVLEKAQRRGKNRNGKPEK